MSSPRPHDPFKKFRANGPVHVSKFGGEKIAMILGHKNVRDATRDYDTYSSDAPFRVPIPSEEDLRRVRQLPIEVNPPEHTEYRKIAEPFFKLPNTSEFKETIADMIERMIREACEIGEVEVVREFSLPMQSLPTQDARIRSGTLDKLGHSCLSRRRRQRSPRHDIGKLHTRAIRPG